MIVFLCTAACVACGNFVLCFPDESRSVHFLQGTAAYLYAEQLFPFFFSCPLSFVVTLLLFMLSPSVFYVLLCNFTTQGQVVRQAFVPKQLSLDDKFWSVQSVSVCVSLCHSRPLSLCFSLSLSLSLRFYILCISISSLFSSVIILIRCSTV